MKVAVEASWAGQTGIGRVYSEVLLRQPDWVEILQLRKGQSNATSVTPLSLSLTLGRVSADVFWSPGFIPPAFYHRMPVAITIHDLTHLHFYTTLHKAYFDLVISRLLKHVAVVFTVSEYSRNEILNWCNLDSERVISIPNGVSPTFCSEGDCFSFGRPYILYIGNRRPYKNISRLIGAFALSGLYKDGFVLAFTGVKDKSITELQNRFGLTDAITFLGSISDEYLPNLYRGATALAFPSLYEGFGLPILEAMSCGIPVLTSNVSAMPEVAGDAAILINPLDVEEIAMGLRKVCIDWETRKTLVSKGFEQAKKFSWDSAGRRYWECLTRLALNR